MMIMRRDIFDIGQIFFLVWGGNGLVGMIKGVIIVRRGITKPRLISGGNGFVLSLFKCLRLHDLVIMDLLGSATF